MAISTTEIQKKHSNSNTTGAVVALLDLPAKSVISFDGQTISLKRNDFVGFSSVPNSSDGSFHLVTVRAGPPSSSSSPSASEESVMAAAVTVGFTLPQEKGAPLIRRYDPQTEEVSATPVDKITETNLLAAINRAGNCYRSGAESSDLLQQRVVPYSRLVSNQHIVAWNKHTGYISNRLLQKRRICAGGKIVAGSYDGEEDNNNQSSAVAVPTTETATATTQQNKIIIDGFSAEYPSIPVISSSSKFRPGVRHSRHQGTKRFLTEQLTPTQRTALFMADNPGSCTLDHVLTVYFDNIQEDLLGDLQLAYVLFQHIHCFSSMEHWRDLVAMLCNTERQGVTDKMDLFTSFLKIFSVQIVTMERDFFDDAELSSGTFLLPSLKQLVSTLSGVQVLSEEDNHKEFSLALANFRNLLNDRFPNQFGYNGNIAAVPKENIRDLDIDDVKMETEGLEEEDEGPVVVSSDDMEASFARSSQLIERLRKQKHSSAEQAYPDSVRLQYPLVFAAMMPHEDAVMTCARALDEASDVSLVREAAAYLENVEASRK